MSFKNTSLKTEEVLLNQDQFSEHFVPYLRSMGFVHYEDVVAKVKGFDTLIPIVIQQRTAEREIKKEGMVLLRDYGRKETQA